jgi:hypothetical protein
MIPDCQLFKLRSDIDVRNQVCALLSQRRWACTIRQHHVRQANRARQHIRSAPHVGKCSPCHSKTHSTVRNTDTTKIRNSICRNVETREREYSRTGIAVCHFIFYNHVTPRSEPSLRRRDNHLFQEIPCHLCKPKVHYRVHRRLYT